MTPEAQRIAIADACGWKRTHEGAKSAWFNPAHQGPGRSMFRNNIPDYLADLNAIHEAEDAILGHGSTDANAIQFRYSHELYTRVVPENIQPFRANAAQRSEALLRALGKWDDTR